MVYVSTLTSKGQATIPLPIRRILDLSTADKVAFVITDTCIEVRPASDWRSLKGSVSAKSKVSEREWDSRVMAAMVKEYQSHHPS